MNLQLIGISHLIYKQIKEQQKEKEYTLFSFSKPDIAPIFEQFKDF